MTRELTRFSLTVALMVMVIAAAVSTSSAAALSDRILQQVRSAVCEKTGYPPEHIVITQHRLRIADKYETADRIRITLPDFSDAIGPVTARAEFIKNGSVLGSMPIPVRVNVYDSVLVTTRKLKRHEAISHNDVSREWIDITRFVKWAISDIDSLDGCRAARTINAGTIVDTRWVEQIPMVLRGDRVTLEYETTGVRVTAAATAMEDGYRQQTIRIKTEYANRLLNAVVTGKGTVAPAQ
jgi:flagella basal body P-ring formation protein FlgA